MGFAYGFRQSTHTPLILASQMRAYARTVVRHRSGADPGVAEPSGLGGPADRGQVY